MENYFRNLTAKVSANEDNPFKSYDFSKFLVNLLYAAPHRWHCANICDVATVQLSNGTVQQQQQKLFMKMYLPSIFILRCVRAKMIVHAFMIELDQACSIYSISKSMESCSLVISQILAEFRLERATYKTLHK